MVFDVVQGLKITAEYFGNFCGYDFTFAYGMSGDKNFFTSPELRDALSSKIRFQAGGFFGSIYFSKNNKYWNMEYYPLGAYFVQAKGLGVASGLEQKVLALFRKQVGNVTLFSGSTANLRARQLKKRGIRVNSFEGYKIPVSKMLFKIRRYRVEQGHKFRIRAKPLRKK